MQTHRTDSESDVEAGATDENRGDEPDADGASDRAVTSISKDDAFHLLQNSRRRAVLRFLIEYDDTDRFRMRDVAEHVAAWEHDTTVQQLVSDERQRVYIALYQSHLPKLDEHDLIDYNQSRGVVEPKPLVAALEPYLAEGLHTDDDQIVVSDEATVETDEPSSGRLGSVTSLFSN